MNFRALFSVLTAVNLAGCAPADHEQQQETRVKTVAQPLATATITDIEGANVGLASIVEVDGSLALNVSLSGLTSGEKALHLHTTGVCKRPDFKSAGGHLNPASVSHGKLSETGPHLGDFPNVVVAEDGLAEVSLAIEGSPQEVLGHFFDDDGTAVMIHAGPDDYESDPAGAAGPRIACGVMAKI